MMNRRVRPWRRLAEALQALFILGIPFIRVRGESALRFDIPSLRLHVFGTSLWMDEFFIVLIAVIFFTFLIVFITQLFGRIWCGWLCPQTVLVDITWFLDKARTGGIAQKSLAYVLTLLVSAAVAASLIWYFVSPYDFFHDLLSGQLGLITGWSWLTMTVIIFLNYAFLRHTWCATVCPYAKLQGALFDNNTMVIAFDNRRINECMNCRACLKVCPVDIDIRHGLNAACINCAECIDTCSEKMERQQKTGLIGYFFGKPGQRMNILRTNVILTGALTLLFFMFLLYLSLVRNPVDLTILPNYEFKPGVSKQHEAVNAYTLAVKNKSRQDLVVGLSAVIQGKKLRVIPQRIRLSAGEYKRVAAYVFVPGINKAPGSLNIELKLATDGPEGIRISRKTNFIIPEVQ